MANPQIFTFQMWNNLKGFHDTNSTIGYYTFLKNAGYDYGTMALGVIQDNILTGRIANEFLDNFRGRSGVRS